MSLFHLISLGCWVEVTPTIIHTHHVPKQLRSIFAFLQVFNQFKTHLAFSSLPCLFLASLHKVVLFEQLYCQNKWLWASPTGEEQNKYFIQGINFLRRHSDAFLNGPFGSSLHNCCSNKCLFRSVKQNHWGGRLLWTTGLLGWASVHASEPVWVRERAYACVPEISPSVSSQQIMGTFCMVHPVIKLFQLQMQLKCWG